MFVGLAKRYEVELYNSFKVDSTEGFFNELLTFQFVIFSTPFTC